METRRSGVTTGADGWHGATGKAGDGPGDFRAITGLYLLAGDSIGVFDNRLVRFSVLDAQGRLHRVMTLSEIRQGSVRPVGMLNARSFVGSVASSLAQRAETGRWRPTESLVRIDLESAGVDTIGHFPGQEAFVAVAGSGRLVTNPPFFRTTVQATRGAEVISADTERFEFMIHDGSGALRDIVRRDHSPSPITDAQIGAWKEQRRESFRLQPSPDAASSERRRLVIDAMTFPDTHPVLARLLFVDALGHVWLPHADATPETGSVSTTMPPDWSVFGPDGRWLGEVRMPSRFRPSDIGADHVLGVTTDELGVEYVVRFDLEKPEE